MMANFRAHLQKYIQLSEDEFLFVSSHFNQLAVAKNETLIKPGSLVPSTYWVKSGFLASSYLDHEDREHVIQFAIENCWITDQNGFYNQSKATLALRALEDAEILSLSYEKRESLCREMQKMEHFFRKKANDSFVKLQARLLTHLTADAQKRFDLLLQEYPGIGQRLSKKMLAAYLGVSRETLSRLGH